MVCSDAADEADALAKALRDRLSYYNSLPQEERVRYAAGEGTGPLDGVDELAQELAELKRRLNLLKGVLEG